MSERPAAEQQTEQQIKVRQVTDVHANWSEQERGAPGKFSFQLILDDGAEEYAIRPPADDADALLDLFKMSETIYFDMGRHVLIFGNISLEDRKSTRLNSSHANISYAVFCLK